LSHTPHHTKSPLSSRERDTSLNYRVGQKVTKFDVFSDPTRKLSALTPERGRIL